MCGGDAGFRDELLRAGKQSPRSTFLTIKFPLIRIDGGEYIQFDWAPFLASVLCLLALSRIDLRGLILSHNLTIACELKSQSISGMWQILRPDGLQFLDLTLK